MPPPRLPIPREELDDRSRSPRPEIVRRLPTSNGPPRVANQEDTVPAQPSLSETEIGAAVSASENRALNKILAGAMSVLMLIGGAWMTRLESKAGELVTLQSKTAVIEATLQSALAANGALASRIQEVDSRSRDKAEQVPVLQAQITAQTDRLTRIESKVDRIVNRMEK